MVADFSIIKGLVMLKRLICGVRIHLMQAMIRR
jgi:hypothetical protein